MVDVRGMLEAEGVVITRQSGNELWGLCPGHEQRTGRVDHSPSWSINVHTYEHHCFSCHYGGDLSSLMKDLTGTTPVDLELRMTTENFIAKAKEIRKTEEVPEVVPLDEWALANILTHVPQRMLDLRFLQSESAEVYGVRWDPEMKQWVLPIRDFRGNLLGAQYRQKGSVQTLPEGIEKSKMFFGFDVCQSLDEAAIVESPLDAVRLHQCGLPAFSTMGAFVSAPQMKVIARNFTRVVVALDNDDAGRLARASLIPGLKRRGCVPIEFNYRGLRDEDGGRVKDPGDVADDAQLRAAIERTLGGSRFRCAS